MEENFWRKCSSCKKPIGFKQAYQRCNVSTCNQLRVALVFCTVSCWSAHVPVYRHRDAWAIEEISPSQEEWKRQAPVLVRPTSNISSPVASKNVAKEVLVVVSKLKNYIKDSADMNTSGEVIDLLSDKLRELCDEAIRHARSEGRKTVMGRDF